jgi:SAM-dependent MidA family methyltransferase
MARAPPPLDAESVARSLRVTDRLRAASGANGFLPFDQFMEIALYEEADGFYERRRSPLGPGGEFYTAAHVHPIFGATLGQRIRAVRAALGNPRPFPVMELGPGDGTLAADIAHTLARDPPGLEYVLVDRSSSRLREAEAKLREKPGSIPVRTSESVGADGPFVGVIIANEFLDAQPARRLRWSGADWRELGIRVRDGTVEPAEGELLRAVPGPALPTPEKPDVVFEFSPLAEGTVREVADHLSEGSAIFLDYGMEESELLLGHPGGTLAAVRDHRFLENPLDSPGTADLSTFVNFSRIRRSANSGGLREVSFRSQAESLGTWGFPEVLDSAVRSAGSPEAEVRLRLAAKNLLFGFDRFRVLELAPPGTAPKLAEVR